jgi:predicted negative regulator of RcsB-dependent stress response
VDRQTRKDLKTDKFALEVRHTYDFISEHRDDLKRYGSIAIVVIALAAGYFYYTRHQAQVREDALAQALKIDDATVGPTPQPTNLSYATADEKAKARATAFNDLANKYRGSAEAAYAQIYLAADSADKGNLADAEKRFRDVVDNGPTNYAAIARLNLADTLVAEGKSADAEKLLRDAVAKPTSTVSADQAKILLAQVVAKRDPAEARKILEGLKTERSAISRQAIQALSEISNTK